jgi:hypothetical protein
MKFSEKMSKKNPPQIPEKMPMFLFRFSLPEVSPPRREKTVMRITAIKTRFEIQPKKPPPRKILKWIKKLV